MKEVTIRIPAGDYEGYILKAQKISENYVKADRMTGGTKEYPPEALLEMAIQLGINRHINANLDRILEESERELNKLEKRE